MAVEPRRVFLDTSALIAGLISSTGAAREVLRLGEAGVIRLVVSEWVVVELDRILSAKFSSYLQEIRHFLKDIHLEAVDDPPVARVKRFRGIIEDDDAPILAAAVEARVDALVTWDKRDFLKAKVKESVGFPILTPAEFLHLFREWLEETDKKQGM
jgi:putative PIN family toxin of toxin-antitoxin system